MRGGLLERTFRQLKALSVNPRTASLGKDWMVVAIVLVVATSMVASFLPPKLTWGLPSNGLLFLIVVLVLSAALVAGHELWRSMR